MSGPGTSSADLAVVLVHYRTPEVVPEAVSALRQELSLCGLEAELFLVDNDSEPGDRETFAALGLEVLGPGSNRGFAAGVNRGVAASRAERLVLMNPDVVVRPGCLAQLCAALDDGAAAAGPRFSWDDEDRLLLPPLEPHSRRWQLTSAAAGYGPWWARRARARWRAHAHRHWCADRPIASYALSGAMLAIRRDAWDRIGPFDDAYRLYFEETDWLRRLRLAGLEARYIPAARARHRYNLSAAREPRAAAWFAESARRFRRRSFGSLFVRGLEVLEGLPIGGRSPALEATDSPGPPSLALAGEAAWVEVSPLAVGFPAAAEPLPPVGDPARGSSFELPLSIWNDLTPGSYALRTVSNAGDELDHLAFRVG